MNKTRKTIFFAVCYFGNLNCSNTIAKQKLKKNQFVCPVSDLLHDEYNNNETNSSSYIHWKKIKSLNVKFRNLIYIKGYSVLEYLKEKSKIYTKNCILNKNKFFENVYSYSTISGFV